jgi:DNA polymerase-4
MAHVYFHIDLNAFYASAEVLLDPSLKGKPVAISGSTRRSVVATASYAARKYGVHSAMPIGEAMKMCRDLIVVPGHFQWYSELSGKFMNLIRGYTKIMSPASIDECYTDMTEVIQRYQRPLDLAVEIQRRVLKELGLPCSIGVGPNLFLAKMASDMKKPLGITVLRIRDVPEKMWPLPISSMFGIGKKTVPLLEDLGIHTIGDLARYEDASSLRPLFGKNTEDVIARANGRDHSEIELSSDPVSMGVSETMLEDVTDYEEIRGLFRSLSRKLSKRLVEGKKTGSRISIRICYYDFHNADRSKQLSENIWKPDDLFVNAMQLFDDNYEEGEAVRLLGISLSNFAKETDYAKQMNLFDQKRAVEEETADVLHDLNRQLGGKVFVRASTLMKENHHETE